MTTEAVGRVGPIQAADGNEEVVRLGKFAEQIVSLLGGGQYEYASRGQLLHASTAVAGVAPGTALSTTPPMALWNPLNSGVLGVLQLVYLGYVSGTLGAGTMVHAQVVGQTTVPTGGTELTPQTGLLSTARGKLRAFQGSTLAATPTILRPSAILGAGVTTTATFPAVAVDEVAGAIVIPPGSCWVYQGVAAAGTTPLVLIGATYAEVPLL